MDSDFAVTAQSIRGSFGNFNKSQHTLAIAKSTQNIDSVINADMW